MDFIKNFTFTPLNVLKAVVAIIVSLFIIIFIYNLLGISSGNFQVNRVANYPTMSVGSMPMDGVAYDYSNESAYQKSSPSLSIRNIAPTSYDGGAGSGAEDFEVTDYNANIETRNKSRDCQEILKLKSLEYVVFENNTEAETYCNFVFKFKHKNVSEIIAVIKGLNPRDFSENTYTIKKQIDDFTSEIEILKKKIDSINTTMESALRAYDEITKLATRSNDASSLAKIIEGKIQIIQRLTDEGINANAQLERLSRAKSEQLDKIDYTYFRVNIHENKYIDWKNIRDSWKSTIRNFFFRINNIIQNSTVSVVVFVFSLIPYLIYLSILLFVGKYFWRFAKHIWQK